MPQQPSDFSKGKVSKNILQLAVPMIFAQLVNVLYSVVDRMYIGHMPESSSAALAGIGLTFPIISIVTAFANLFGTGGTPLFSIARGEDNTDRARYIMGSTFVLLVITGLALTFVGLLCKRPILYLFSASEATFPFANDYLSIYLCGSVFVMLSLGMNGFINAQGFGRKGMLTVVLGAVTNIVLDPLFIFVFDLGVKGAAIATVISQFISALWAVGFLYRRAPILLRKADMHPSFSLVREITVLGFSGFIVNVTNSSVQIVCNATLRAFGGDLYVSVMTIINSVREVAFAPINGLTGATQPVLGFNYGAKEYGRVRQGIRYMSILCVSYTIGIWLCISLCPEFFIRIFTSDSVLTAAALPSMHIYFFGFFMMALQLAGQTAAVGLGRSKQAIFFSLLRKVFIVIPLTLFLPHLFHWGVTGVFLAEPISNFLGGGACFITMIFTIWKELGRLEQEKQSACSAG
ncbi:MAG: MATE family efflux transporter [Acutalibacteraceae bacterium]